jgi:2-polyprenyl-6-methoxyphenol hydroxylase-like FAD-dependent oxidoreductase
MPSAARTFAAVSNFLPSRNAPTVLGKAVVLGGSVAGLLTARVLSDYVDSVVIMDRDDLHASGPRAGAPQGTQLHALLPGGLRQLERLFPGFREEAIASGACPAPATMQRQYLGGARKVMVPDDPEILTGSRPFIEGLVRQRVLGLPNVKTVAARAMGLVIEGGRTTGVRHETGGEPGVESADLVVDAMGRSSRLSEWLEEGGWERPAMRRMTINLNYATAEFSRHEEPELNMFASFGAPDMAPVAIVVCAAIEDGRWQATLSSYRDDRPGFTAEDFTRRLRSYPLEFRRVAEGGMLGDVRTYRQADSRRRDFHTLRRMPGGLVAIGDSVASFNPVYGQGMASAALQAACLAMYLQDKPDVALPARRFLDLQKVVVDAVWWASTSGDLALPHVRGPYPRGYRLTSWFSKQIMAATITDVEIARRFNAVAFMLAHPSTLAAPGTVLRALWVNRRARR